MPKLDLQIPAHFERARSWRTDDPLSEIWRHLLLFSDLAYLKDKWNATDEAYTAVTTFLRQAHEYYIAGRTVTLMTRPLLSYYSTLNLAKAILYVVNDSPSSDYHGLCKPQMADNLLDVSVETNNGVFIELANLSQASIAVGTRLQLEDFLVNMLDMQDHYCTYFNRISHYIWPSVTAYYGGKVEVSFASDHFKGKTVDEFRNLLKERTSLYEDFEEEESDEPLKLVARETFKGEERSGVRSELIQKHFEFSVFPQNYYFINLLDLDKQMPPMCAYFGAMYVLSEIVRYAPNHIHRFLREPNTSVEWFIQQLCSISERVFPNLLFNALTGERHKFASSF